jgi:hypothetical protein
MDVDTLNQESTETTDANSSVETNNETNFDSGKMTESDFAKSRLEAFMPKEEEANEPESDNTSDVSDNTENSDLAESVEKLAGEANAEDAANSESEEETISNDVAESTQEDTQTEYTQEQIDVLSQIGVDIDKLDEVEAKKLARAFGVESIKRFGRLTGQKKERDETIAQLETQLAELKSKPTEPVVLDSNNEYANITNMDELQKELDDAQAIIDWADDSMFNDTQYDDEDGKEYIAELSGKKYDKQELQRIKNNAQRALRKNSPLNQRRQFLEQQYSSDAQALQDFSFLNDQKSEEFKTFNEMIQVPMFKSISNNYANGNYLIALMIEGEKALRGQQTQASKPPVKKVISNTPPKATISNTTSVAPQRNGNSDLQKEYEAAQKAYLQSGSTADMVRARTLQRKLSSL